MKLYHTSTLMMALLSGAAWAGGAADASATTGAWRWGAAAGFQNYREPLMQLQGPELGLISRWQASDAFKLEGQLFLARLAYDSRSTGHMRGVRQAEGVLRILGPAASLAAMGRLEPSLQWSYTYNDLRGLTSTGHAGYERHLNNLWAGARWSSPELPTTWPVRRISLDLQTLVKGRQHSMLSQVGADHRDVTTETKSGWAWTLQARVPGSQAEFQPYLRWQQLDRSNTVFNGQGEAAEPSHRKIWVGLNWWLN